MRICVRIVSCAACALAAGCAGPGAGKLVRVVEDIAYVPGSRLDKHRLDLYVPRQKADYPVVVFVHGGYWTGGDRRYYAFFTGLYGRIGIALARRGVGTAVISYRLAPGTRIAGQVADVVAAVRWVRAHIGRHGGDPRRLFVMGHSAGGHLAALLGTDATHLRAAGIDQGQLAGVVAMSPVLDLEHMKESNDADFDAEVTRPTFGDDPATLRRWSPSSHFRADQRPMLILLGDDDYPYLVEQVRRAVARLEKLGAPVEFARLEDRSHAGMVLKFGDDGDAVVEKVARYVNAKTRRGR